MEDPPSVSSPRRTLSFSKRRRTTLWCLAEFVMEFYSQGLLQDWRFMLFSALGLFSLSSSLLDDFSREPEGFVPLAAVDEQPIEPISDIGINRVNEIMFR